MIDSDTTLFFDASVLVAGAHSPSGGSALLLEACRRGGFTAQITFAVLLETLRTLQSGFPEETLRRFHRYLTQIRWDLLPVPEKDILTQYGEYLDDPDDAHVLAASAEVGSAFLITLDKHHILAARRRVEQADISVSILRPGEFIHGYYLQHEEYPSLPEPRNASTP